MSYRFRKSVKLAPGIRLNFNKKSVGISAGVKGARVSINSSGRKTASVGIPGTGIYYSQSTGVKRTKAVSNTTRKQKVAALPSQASNGLIDGDIPSLSTTDEVIHNQKVAMVGYSIVLGLLAILFLPITFPFGILLSVLCIVGIYFVIKEKKAKLAEFARLRDILLPVQEEIPKLRAICSRLDSETDAGSYFLLYDQFIDLISQINEKSPGFFGRAGDKTAEQIALEGTAENTDRIIIYAYENATKNFTELKTQKGMEARITRFKNIFMNNERKLSDNQKANVSKKVEEMRKIMDMSFSE